MKNTYLLTYKTTISSKEYTTEISAKNKQRAKAKVEDTLKELSQSARCPLLFVSLKEVKSADKQLLNQEVW